MDYFCTAVPPAVHFRTTEFMSFYFSLSAKGNLAVAMVLVMTSIWHHWLIILKNSPSRDQVPTTILILSSMRWEWVEERLTCFFFFLPIQSMCSSFCFILITLIWQTHHVKLLVALTLSFSFLCVCVFVNFKSCATGKRCFTQSSLC